MTAQIVQILPAHQRRIQSEPVLRQFHILKERPFTEWKIQFIIIHDMQHKHFMATMAKMMKRTDQCFRIFKKIAYNNHQPPVGDPLRYFMQQ